MKSVKGKRLFAFIMSVVLTFTTLASDASLLTARAEDLVEAPFEEGEEDVFEFEGEELGDLLEEPAEIPQRDVKVTYEFYVGESLVETQIVNDGDTLTAPQVPKQGTDVFLGWYSGEVLFTGFGVVSIPEEVTEDSTVCLYAKFAAEAVHIYYHDYKVDRIVYTANAEKNASYTIENVSVDVDADRRLEGWTTVPGGSVESTVAVSESDIDLYPVTKKVFWIYFDTQGGSLLEPAYTYGDRLPALPTPVKPGYTFSGWRIDGKQIKDSYRVKSDVTLTAYWVAQKVSYQVVHLTENANDDEYSYVLREVLTGNAGNKTSAKAKNVNGYQAQTIQQTTIKGDGSTVVYVYYKRTNYTIHLRRNTAKGVWTEVASITAKHGQNIKNMWPTEQYPGLWGYDHDYATAKSPYVSFLEVMPAGNLYLYYLEPEGTITSFIDYYFENLDGDYEYAFSVEAKNDIKFTVSDEDMMDIEGFTVNKKLSAKVDDSVSVYGGNVSKEDVEATKIFYDRNSYNIYYVVGNTTTTSTHKFGDSLDGEGQAPQKPASIGDGYVFAGWFDNGYGVGDPYVFEGKTMPAYNIYVGATWVADKHEVKFVTNSDGVEIDSQTILYGSFAEKPLDPTKDGYIFAGWTCEGEPFNFTTPIYKDTVLEAKWIKNESLSVVYVSEYGDAPTDSRLYLEKNHVIVKDAPANIPEGKLFVGWRVGEITVYPFNSIELHDNLDGKEDGIVTFEAVFTDPIPDTAILYKADSTDAGVAVSIVKNARITVLYPDNTRLNFVKDGYKFNGWKDADGKRFEAGAKVDSRNIAGNVLIADWKKKEVTVTITEATSVSPYKYDGTTKSISGYTVETTDPEYTEMDFEYVGNADKLTVSAVKPGEYPMELTAEDFHNTNIIYDDEDVKFVIVDGSLKIANNDNEIVITAKSDEKDYDGTPLTNNNIEVAGGLSDGDRVVAQVSGSITNVSENASGNNVVDSYVIYNSNDEDVTSFYNNVRTENGTLTINYRKVTVTPVNDSKVYGEDDPELTATVSPAVIEGDSLSYSLARTEGEDAGEYDIFATGLEYQGNYKVTYENGIFTILKASGNFVNVSDQSYPYNKSAQGVGATSTSGAVITYSVDGGEYSAEVPTLTDVGTVTVTAKAYNPNYENAEETKTYTLKVTPLAVTVKADDKYVVYGDAAAELTATVTGTLEGDAGLINKGTLVCDRQDKAGEYTISFENTVKDQGNYTVDYVPGKYVIAAKADEIIITADSASKMYDGKELTMKSYTLNDDSIILSTDVLTVDIEGTITNVGLAANKVTGYKVMRGDVDVTDSYTFGTPVDGQLTITKRDVLITSGSAVKTYDSEPLTNDEITISGSGFVEGEGVTCVVLGTITNAGSVDNNFSLTYNEGTDADNYDVTLVAGTLTVRRVELEVVVKIAGNNETLTYDGEEHTLTGYSVVSISNDLYKASDIEASDVKTVQKNAGSYNIGYTADDFANISDNFLNVVFEVEDGTLLINRREVTIRPHNYTKNQGDSEPSYFVYVENAVPSDPVTVYAWRYLGSDEEEPGTYPISITIPGGEASYPNYIFKYVNAYLVIIGNETPEIIPEVSEETTTTDTTPLVIVTEEVPLTEEPDITPEEVVTETPEPVEVVEETITDVERETPDVLDINEEVPLANGENDCWIHWLILLTTLVYAVYIVLRSVANKKEIDNLQNKEN